VAHKLQVLRQRNTSMAQADTVHDRMLDRHSGYGARVEAITAPESSTTVVAYLSGDFSIGSDLGHGLISP